MGAAEEVALVVRVASDGDKYIGDHEDDGCDCDDNDLRICGSYDGGVAKRHDFRSLITVTVLIG
jgi:hypothetical protein